MSTYLLDTSVLIDALRGRRGTVEALRGFLESGDLLACSAITVAELFAARRPRERKATVTRLDNLVHYDVTRPVAERAGLLRAEWASRGRPLALPDLLIVAVAVLHGFVLVSGNVKDFPIEDLRVLRLPGREPNRDRDPRRRWRRPAPPLETSHVTTERRTYRTWGDQAAMAARSGASGGSRGEEKLTGLRPSGASGGAFRIVCEVLDAALLVLVVRIASVTVAPMSSDGEGRLP